MQGFDWDDLKVLIALSRHGSFAASGLALGQDETTVARRIRRLEHRLAASLVQRGPSGRQSLTELGLRIASRALAMETETRKIAELVGQNVDMLVGSVRVTAVPVLVDHVLVPASKPFLRDHPGLTLDLIPESRNMSLTRREADLALRLGQPKTGGTATRTQRIGWLEFGVYRRARSAAATTSDWILYQPEHAHLEQAVWMQPLADKQGASNLRVSDLNTAIEAVAQGIGQSLLPILAADPDPRLCRVDNPDGQPLPRRPIWLLSHADQAHLHAIQHVKAWLSALSWTVDPPRHS